MVWQQKRPVSPLTPSRIASAHPLAQNAEAAQVEPPNPPSPCSIAAEPFHRYHPHTPMKQALLTIGMTVFNDESILEPALDRLKATAPPGTRLVVFDNRSTDRSPEILARYGAIVTRGNLPQADALNVLAAGAMSKYLLLLHGDVFFLSPTWFDACAAELEKGHALVSPDDCGLGNYVRADFKGMPESSFMMFDVEKLHRLRKADPSRYVKRLLKYRHAGPLRVLPLYVPHVTHALPDAIKAAGFTWKPMAVYPSRKLDQPWFTPPTGQWNWREEWGYYDYGFGNFYSLGGTLTHYHNWYSRDLFSGTADRNADGVPMEYIRQYTRRFLADLKSGTVHTPAIAGEPVPS
jgi:glycosyltransferase involved in cell wall biosynthesis